MSRYDLISVDRANDIAHERMPGGWVPDSRSPIDHWRGLSWLERIVFLAIALVVTLGGWVVLVVLFAMGGPS